MEASDWVGLAALVGIFVVLDVLVLYYWTARERRLNRRISSEPVFYTEAEKQARQHRLQAEWETRMGREFEKEQARIDREYATRMRRTGAIDPTWARTQYPDDWHPNWRDPHA